MIAVSKPGHPLVQRQLDAYCATIELKQSAMRLAATVEVTNSLY